MVDVTRIIESAVKGQTLPARQAAAKELSHETQKIIGARNADGTVARPEKDGFTAGDAAVIGVAAATGGVGLVAAPLVKKFVNGLFGDKPLDGGELAGKAKTGLSDMTTSLEGAAADGKSRLQKLGGRAAEAVTPAAAASAPAAAPAAFVGPPEPTIGQKISGWFSETFGGAKTAVTGAAASVATAATMATASPPPEPPAAPVAAAAVVAPVVEPVVTSPVAAASVGEPASADAQKGVAAAEFKAVASNPPSKTPSLDAMAQNPSGGRFDKDVYERARAQVAKIGEPAP